ncbi:protein SENSITIVE TO UV 2-like [Hibiscus syriacus]|uniref:protein SENSITIVE TO UV 2-like n=1 Tax=Hibiscus syriacus TaxID=106335 RepID=UPI00192395ED|nr:protein SENSITIVE TO UV 2-like [Hibiscus syriacus]
MQVSWRNLFKLKSLLFLVLMLTKTIALLLFLLPIYRRSRLHRQPLNFLSPPSRTDSISYSPPRELSQIPIDLGDASNSSGFIAKCATHSTPVRRDGSSANAEDLEIELLKKELGRVSRQLADLEHECSELKKERNKEDHATVSNSNNEAKVANLKDISFNDREHGVPVATHDGVVQKIPNRKSFNDQIGLRTEKLLDIWGLLSEQKFGRNLISKLFAVCSEDIDVLCGFINSETTFG